MFSGFPLLYFTVSAWDVLRVGLGTSGGDMSPERTASSLVVCLVASVLGANPAKTQALSPADTLPPAEAKAIAADAYLYAYPLLYNYKTLFQQAVDPSFPGYVGGFNRYRHYARGFTPADKDIVTPSNDTPYSWAWLDLRAEPMVVSVPARRIATMCCNGSIFIRTTLLMSARVRPARKR